ncbi:MAG: PSD1 and planctomycete cytochrome C domain-containing protein [Planctomycetota bacterium]|nr:PSD1 and planctomycete cytochrome C domain-containing protein [Planctomycetota bacterium]
MTFKKYVYRASCFLLIFLCETRGQSQEDKRPTFTAAQLDHFETKIRPLLAKRCFQCHGPEAKELEGGLQMGSRKGLLNGGETGPAIVPGHPEKSILIDAINYGEVYEMPPDSKMPAEEIALLTEWVKQKAPWPQGDTSPLAEIQSLDIAQRKKEHWAWQPLKKATPPRVKNSDWPLDGLDHFVLAKNEKSGLEMAPPANRRTWIRRVYFDLVGLPPPPEQVETFVSDTSDDAMEKVVDNLLASRQFGERWARHWMDLIRYAETCGHEFEYPIPHAHQYRSYLIRAFNEDVPYDLFVKEHLAGDLIQNPRRNREQKLNESIIGTGFWFLHEATHSPVDVRLDEANHIDNRIDVMSKSFLGLTVACARCHDHKFDAISTRDYYALAGFLQSSRRQLAMLDPLGKIEQSARQIRQVHQSVSQKIRDSMSVKIGTVEQTKNYLLAASQGQRGASASGTVMLEGEDIKVTDNTGGRQVTQNLGPKWSGGKQLFWTAGKPQVELKFEISIANAGEYGFHLGITKAPDYGIFQVLVDGKPLGNQVDGFHPTVLRDAKKEVGTVALTKGKHLISLKTIGTHPQANPKQYMVGIDFLELVPIRKPASETRKELLDPDIDPIKLNLWTEEFSRASQQAAHPLWLWQQVTKNGTTFDKGVLAALVDSAARERQLNASKKLPYVFADFSQPDFADWFVTGEAFAAQPTRNGHWVAGEKGASYYKGGMADSSQYSKKLQGVLRSPTFELKSNEIWYRIKGANAKIRLIIDGYVMDIYNGLLFRGVSIDVNTKGQFQWVRQSGDMRRYKGHRAHIEIIDQGGGYAVVDKIVFSDGGRPDFVPEFAAKLLPSVSTATRLEEFALQYAQALLKLPQHGLAGVGGGQDLALMINTANQKIATIEKQIPGPILVQAIADGTPEDEHVFIRGNHKAQGDRVERRLLEALSGPGSISGSDTGSGRLELANQIVSPENPLTSRVIVNRLWHHVFGRGIVASTDNFGVLGHRPSHPQLLDYLANEFVSQGWSIKKMLRRMVLSQTYRMSSKLNPKAHEIDPGNTQLHRMSVRRLQAEAIRDSMLAISGRLDPKVEGPSVALHLTPFMQGRGRPGRSGPVDGAGRRSLYVEIRRNFLPPMLVAFDMPIPFNSVGRRNLSNVPAQALILMNDPFVVGQAEVWSKKLIATTPDIDERIQRMYLQAFARPPRPAELESAREFLELQRKERQIEPGDVVQNVELWKDLCHVLLNVKEFIYLQ